MKIKGEKNYSWACSRVVDDKGKTISGGCGGNWGPKMPEKCPDCGGKLQKTDQLLVVKLNV